MDRFANHDVAKLAAVVSVLELRYTTFILDLLSDGDFHAAVLFQNFCTGQFGEAAEQADNDLTRWIFESLRTSIGSLDLGPAPRSSTLH